jgi:hypothetical protein
MDKIATFEAGLPAVELGRWMGRREAFGIMAGQCSAADVESLRRIRQEKSYRALDCTWADFCRSHLHVARRSVDRAIGYLQEFGPAFFHLTQLVHISPGEFRSIAQHVTDRGLEVDGNVIALLPENSRQVTAAVGDLLKRLEPDECVPPPPAFDDVLKRCRAAAEMLVTLPPKLTPRQRQDLASAVNDIRTAAEALGVRIAA